MPMAEAAPLTQGLEEQESLQQLRQALLDLRPEEKEVFLLTAKRRADLRADRRDAQSPGGHRQNPDAQRSPKAAQGAGRLISTL